CDFENDLCNWKNNGTVSWNITREGSRKFISFEVSPNWIGLARLVGPVIYISESMMYQSCLRFSYSIKGAAINTLWVYVNINGIKSVLWNCTGSSQGWITQYINILNGSEFQIEFEGNVEYGTVNVDDILVLYTTCPVYLQNYRRRRRRTASKMGLIPLSEGKKTKHLEECEYSKVKKRSGTTTADQTETDFSQIYDNQFKPETYQMTSHSTPEVDQTYDHIHQEEKPLIPYDPTYDHTTFGSRLYGQIPNIPSVVPNASLHHTEYATCSDADRPWRSN
ncbi:hypothetical protein ACJMK2_025258, partial [Sinanodonta woodiana]